ncbi:phage head-tail connector protein [Senegalia massiliensis]|uniref:Phage gp6-like head-tail connector protein n=1 Tax=Senegalia massiliensis TaxID=1720316 RepID=A0A845R0Z7_9CLOT|nr:phage head-tail connector protein [Senegalia massiliensis]NBI08241.1 hypothetical protein [Senegalia massiliensis]
MVEEQNLLDRVKTRLPGENQVDDAFLAEIIRTIQDRLNLRLGTETLPKQFYSILVDAVIKMYRRKYYEGIKSESIDTISTSFADDVLKEYETEINSYIDSKKVITQNVVRFL